MLPISGLSYPPTWHNTMNVRMQQKILSPGVKCTDHTRFSSWAKEHITLQAVSKISLYILLGSYKQSVFNLSGKVNCTHRSRCICWHLGQCLLRHELSLMRICPQPVHRSIWPPSEAVRHRLMASGVRSCQVLK